MPQAPAVLGDLVESLLGRAARVHAVDEPAPGLLDLDVQAEPPGGGWQPGHELQIRVAPNLTRRYSVRSVTGGDRIRILATTEAGGPGAAWLRTVRPGGEFVLVTARHRALREHGGRRLYLGDGCSLGTIEALAGTGGPHVVAVEVPAAAVAPVSAGRPGYRVIAATGEPGQALQSWLESAIADGSLAGIDGALLLGHAQSLQRQRRALVAAGTVARRAVTTKPYWATGRRGL